MDIWEALRGRLDYASFVPTPVADVERADLERRDGTPYTVLKNPHGDNGAGRYLRLDPADVALFELMDGRRSIQDILVAHLEATGTFALERLARLSAALRANGFFGEEPPALYEKLFARRATRDPLIRLSLLLRRLFLWDIARWSNANGVVDRVYRAGGRFAFTRPGAALLLGFGLYGLVVWFEEIRSPRHSLVTIDDSYVLGILALIALQVLSISVHEAGHALAIRHYGRHVRRVGFAMMYLFPCFYVDSTDMSLGSRRQRIVVSLAGPFAGLTVAAACAIVAARSPESLAGGLAFKAASLFVFQFVFNLLPILELDGYHVLVDALDAPFLRQRALAFVRGQAMWKLRRRARWSKEEIGLALFGGSALVISLLTLGFSLFMWQTRMASAATELLAVGPGGVVVLLLLVLVFVGPPAVALVTRAFGVARNAARLATARRTRAAAEELNARISMLARVRFLAGLPRPALAAFASQLRIEHVEPGALVVTAGDVGDRFYLVRSGRLRAIAPDGTDFGTIVPGEGFGELALLDRTTRTATVEALERVELWSLDRSHFERWVRDRLEVAARIRADRGERDALAALPFFRGLSGQELDRIAARLRIRQYLPGNAVVTAGEAADGYYLIRQGTATVTLPDAQVVRRLGPGEAFGELALLFGGPRTATVTADGPLTVAVLGRADFTALVRASGESASEFRARTGHYVGAGLGGAVSGG